MKKNKVIIIMFLLCILILEGGTLAYFNSRHVNETTLSTKVYSTKSSQNFTSPEDFLPGTSVNMDTKIKNTGEVVVAVRAQIEESWTGTNNTSLPLYQTRNNKYYRAILFNTNSSQECLTTSCATDNSSINSDWIYSNGYYYYKYYLNHNEETTSLIDSLLFNSYIENEMNCTTNELGQNVCSSTGNGYDNATYNLTITFETVQSDVYRTYWNTNQSITEKLPAEIVLPLNRTKENLQFGDEICIEGDTTECFNFIRYDGNDVVMLAKYNLNTSSHIQSSNANNVAFSNDTYWFDETNGDFYSQYSDGDIYDPNYDSETGNNYSIAYYVKAYKQVLDNYGVVLKEMRLLTEEEVTSSNINCRLYKSCSTTFATNTSFWLGSAYYNQPMVIVNGMFTSVSHDTNYGVRPVIVIEKANL